ncbi:MAG TPA: endonuclease/exonuclease/phosphatase family protein [Vicinamibacterales bacterium]|nr:endonuclease/exonuclease/phosphatase family protein [Vicinamibacterales bacterium]
MSLRLVTWNIQRGGSGREQAIASVLRAANPDVVVLQEATQPAVVERVAHDAGMQAWGALPRTSLGFLSRVPLAHHAWYRPRFSRHAFLEIVPAGTSLRIYGVHLAAVHAAWTERRRALELKALLRSIARHPSGPHVLTGDFNTLAPGELLDVRALPRRLRTLVWLSGGRIRWRTIQRVLDAGYLDAFRARHPSEPGLTFPTWSPHVRLDYVFVPAGDAPAIRDCRVLVGAGAAAASDHFPVLSEIAIGLPYPDAPGG